MKIAQLKTLDGRDAENMRGTAGQDSPSLLVTRRWWKPGRRLTLISAAAALLLFAMVAAVRGWVASGHTISRERLRIATVVQGHFVRDVAAQGTIVAAVNPTVFATAAGTIDYNARAGDRVTRGQVLATLDSPALRNEYERERATLESLNTSLQRQALEIRRLLLRSQQQSDLARVQIQAADRELKRAQASWDLRVISQRDFQRAEDDLATAKLNFDNARDSTALERDSLNLDLRSHRLDRDRQALIVQNLKRRVDELTIRAPVDGMLASLATQQKAAVAENAPLLTVVDLSVLEVEFQVAEVYATDIHAGMAAEISLDGRSLPGVVASISPEVRQNQVIGRLRFTGEQPKGLRQNQRAAVRIVLDERDNVIKFERGSQIDEGTRFVYVVHGDTAVRQPVNIGAVSIADAVVLQGLKPGDQGIVSDTRDFRDAPELLIGR